MTSIGKLLGANIKACRNNLGISQEKLAAMSNMATNYLGLIEGGKKFPSAGMIEKIAAALGKEPSELFSVTPVQQGWKEHILLKMNALIDGELASLRQGEALHKHDNQSAARQTAQGMTQCRRMAVHIIHTDRQTTPEGTY